MNIKGDNKPLVARDIEEIQHVPAPDRPPSQAETAEAVVPREDSLSAPNLSWPPTHSVIDVTDLDWGLVENALTRNDLLPQMPRIANDFQRLLEQKSGSGMLFDLWRSDPQDKAIQVTKLEAEYPLWFIGDLHGDLLALEASLLLIRKHALHGSHDARILFLGDLFDDGGYGLEVLLRIFELAAEAPNLINVIAGNHDEALGHNGVRFTSVVEPSDFSDFLNENIIDETIVRVGKLAIRFFTSAPRALFLPDGLLVAHGGFPLSDLHSSLWETGNWNDPRCLSDFVWTRAHPTARKKLPNRHSKGSQFGHEDFATFCSLATSLGRTVTHMVRGHDHVEDRFATYPSYTPKPILTTNALSRRLGRELTGPFERAPTVALYKKDSLPQVFRIQVPPELVRRFYGDQSNAIRNEGAL